MRWPWRCHSQSNMIERQHHLWRFCFHKSAWLIRSNPSWCLTRKYPVPQLTKIQPPPFIIVWWRLAKNPQSFNTSLETKQSTDTQNPGPKYSDIIAVFRSSSTWVNLLCVEWANMGFGNKLADIALKVSYIIPNSSSKSVRGERKMSKNSLLHWNVLICLINKKCGSSPGLLIYNALAPLVASGGYLEMILTCLEKSLF